MDMQTKRSINTIAASGNLVTRANAVVTALSTIILGKTANLRLALTCLLAGGHLLIEDLPGVGKTTLAHGLARVLGLSFKRIQFTSDLLPADVIGATIYLKSEERFQFQPGPVFTQVLLADELNRATPRTQSALLEAMEEQQATVDGHTHALPKPFFVIATQNPMQQVGTYSLPESQLDRFLMRLQLGYPDRAAEAQLLKGQPRSVLLTQLAATLTAAEVIQVQQHVSELTVSDALIAYIQDILDYTRQQNRFVHGLSPRGGLALKRGAQAWAWLAGRNFVVPEDVQAILPSVLAHRLHPTEMRSAGHSTQWLEQLLRAVPIP